MRGCRCELYSFFPDAGIFALPGVIEALPECVIAAAMRFVE
jgi:hypothetical protein